MDNMKWINDANDIPEQFSLPVGVQIEFVLNVQHQILQQPPTYHPNDSVLKIDPPCLDRPMD